MVYVWQEKAKTSPKLKKTVNKFWNKKYLIQLINVQSSREMMNTPSSKQKSQLGQIHIQAAPIVKIKLMIHEWTKNRVHAASHKAEFWRSLKTMTASAVGIVKNKFSSCFVYIDIKLKIFFL
jgi:L-lactate permease